MDEFANKTLNMSLKIKNYPKTEIEDDFVKNTLNQNLKINKYKIDIEHDELVSDTLDKNLKIKKENYLLEQDKLLRYIDKQRPASASDNSISFEDNDLNLKLKVIPVENYSTKTLVEGDYINFKLACDTKIGNIIYKKGDTINARVENIVKNGIWGAPAEIIVDNFKINNVLLSGQINKRGADRALWVYPCVYIFSIFFGAGLLMIPIRGGHVKFKTNKIYDVNI